VHLSYLGGAKKKGRFRMVALPRSWLCSFNAVALLERAQLSEHLVAKNLKMKCYHMRSATCLVVGMLLHVADLQAMQGE
jgi:hypothetical protein